MFRPRTFYGLTKMKFEPSPVYLNWGSITSVTKLETGMVLGYDSIETINGLSYYKVASGGRYTSRQAILNFKTTSANLQITIKVRRTGRSIVCIGNLDSDSNTTYQTMISKGSSSSNYVDLDVKVTVPTAGDHFIKIYIRTEGEGSTSDKANFYLTPYNITTNNYNNATANVTIKSHRKQWAVISKPSWIVAPTVNTTGNDGAVLVITAQPNFGTQRSGNIVFRNEKNKDYTLLVILRVGTAQVILSKNIVEVDKEAATVSVSILLINNTKWTLTGLPSWITTSKTTGSNESINLTIQVNNSSATRTATLTFRGDIGGSLTLKITQDYQVNLCSAQGGCICYHDDYCASDCPSYRACTCNSENCSSNCTCNEGCTCNNDLVTCKGYDPGSSGSVCQPLHGGTICSGDCYDCQLYCDEHSCGCNYRDVISPIPCPSNSCDGYSPRVPCTCNTGHCSNNCPCNTETCCACDGEQPCTCESKNCTCDSYVVCTCNTENCSCDGYKQCTCNTLNCGCDGYKPCTCDSETCTCQGTNPCSCNGTYCSCDGYKAESCSCNTQCDMDVCLRHCDDFVSGCGDNNDGGCTIHIPCDTDYCGNVGTGCATKQTSECQSDCPSLCSAYCEGNNICVLYVMGSACSCDEVCSGHTTPTACTCENVCPSNIPPTPCSCNNVNCSPFDPPRSCTCENVCPSYVPPTCTCENVCDPHTPGTSCTCHQVCAGTCTCDTEDCGCHGYVPCSCNSQGCPSDTKSCSTNYCGCNSETCPSDTCPSYCNCDTNDVSCPSNLLCSCNTGYEASSCSVVNCSNCPSFIACGCDDGTIVRCPSYVATQGSYCTPQCYSDTYCDCYNYVAL